jgi:hypothetical protein
MEARWAGQLARFETDMGNTQPLHDEELCDLYGSPRIARIVKPRRL